MASRTLLELTQNILSAMDSDEVNSIYDTVESLQVATIVLETMEAEFNNIDLPSFEKIIKLEPVSDVDKPNYLRYGEGVNNIRWLRYRDGRNRDRYKEVLYLTPSDFFGRLTLVTSTGPNVREIVDPSGVRYFIKTNSAPTFYTSVDNDYLIFDSYDSDYDDSLQETNTFAVGSADLSAGALEDSYVPPIPSNLFPLLLAESKATCFLTLKQMASPKSEQIARRQRSRMQNNLYKSRKADYPYARSKYTFARNR